MTPTQLKQILPACRDFLFWSGKLPLAEAFEVNTPVRWAAFIAQAGHESTSLTRLVESTSYSVRGLMRTWPGRFPTPESTNSFARNPERLANYVYANRLGNGPMESGDGWKYRGRALIQTTGKANYAKAGGALGLNLVERPALLEIPENAVRASAYFWQSNGLNQIVDTDTVESFKAITKAINGGYKGWDERVAIWKRARAALGVPALEAA